MCVCVHDACEYNNYGPWGPLTQGRGEWNDSEKSLGNHKLLISLLNTWFQKSRWERGTGSEVGRCQK